MPVEGLTIRIPIVPEGQLDAVSATTLKLLEAAENPGVGKIVMPFIYNPRDIFEAMQLFDLINGHPKDIALIVSGLSTPTKTLALQAAKRRIATPNTFFMLHSLVSGSANRLKADDADAFSTSISKMQETGQKLIVGKAGIPQDLASDYFRKPVVYTVEEARKIGTNGLIDGTIFDPTAIQDVVTSS